MRRYRLPLNLIALDILFRHTKEINERLIFDQPDVLIKTLLNDAKDEVFDWRPLENTYSPDRSLVNIKNINYNYLNKLGYKKCKEDPQ